MEYFCTIYTEGGPIAVLPQDKLAVWDGDKDYYRATRLPHKSFAALMPRFKSACDVVLIQQESDGNYRVLYDDSNLAIISIIYAAEGYGPEERVPDILSSITARDPRTLDRFGGKLAIFDAALAGSAITQHDIGCQYVLYRDELPNHNSAAVVQLDRGNWELVELYCKQQYVSFSGALFRRVR